MARTVRAVARSAPTRLKLSQPAPNRLRRLVGNVDSGARRGQGPSEVTSARSIEADTEEADVLSEHARVLDEGGQQPGLESNNSPNAEDNPQEPSLSHSHPKETFPQKIAALVGKVESPSRWENVLSQGLPSLENGPSAGAIGLDSPVASPFFSSPPALSDKAVEKAVIKLQASDGKKTGSTAIPPKILQNGRLVGRKCLITGATSGIGNYLSL